MVWFIPAAISAVLLLRGHRMITVVGGLIGGLAGFIASDFLFNAVPMLLQWELYVKIGLVVLALEWSIQHCLQSCVLWRELACIWQSVLWYSP